MTFFLGFLGFYFFPYFFVSLLLCKLHGGWRWGLGFVHSLSPTPRTGGTVRQSTCWLDELNEGFASVFSLVLRISEPVMEIEISGPRTHGYQRFAVFVFTFGGNYSSELHLFMVGIFQLRDCQCSVAGRLWWVPRRRSLPSLALLLISVTLACPLQAPQLKPMQRLFVTSASRGVSVFADLSQLQSQ